MLSPDVQRLARLHRDRQQQLAGLASDAVRRQWSRLTPTAFTTAWTQAVGPAVLALVTAAQMEAARGAQQYVGTAVSLQGQQPDPAGAVPPAAFAGVASDGRTLAGLLGNPIFDVGAFVDGGMPATQALAIGLRHLLRIVATQVQDAARVSTGVAIVSDRRTRGYIRVVTPPACSRCVILGGKWYAYNAGFARHPHCDCTQAPAVEVVQPQSPRALYESMSDEQRRTAGWSEADMRAIADGGNLYQVTNAARDLRSVQIAGRPFQTTLHGATRRGLAGQRLGAPARKRAIRLTPEAIYAEADRLGWSRDETLRVLKQHGYIL